MDSVAKLKKHAENTAVNSANWHLLTGRKAEIYKLAQTSYFAEEDIGFSKNSTEFLHTEYIFLINKQKNLEEFTTVHCNWKPSNWQKILSC